MKRWYKVGLAGLAILATALVVWGYATAQTAPSSARNVLISIPCYRDAAELALALQVDYGEEPIASSFGYMQWAKSKDEITEMAGTTLMFANSATKSYSNVLVFKDGTACVLNTGLDFKPVPRR